MKPSFTLREWDTLRHGSDEGRIPPNLAISLVELARKSRFAGRAGHGVLEDRRQELRARGVVGVLATQGCSLEILPKIDVGAEGSPDRQNAAIRKRLVHMLAVALDLRIEAGQIAELDWQRETLLEILIRLFCDKLTETVRRGMPRRYVGHEEDLGTLRGALDMARQFTRHAANPGRLACRFDELSEDIALNRILKAAVVHLSKMSRNVANQQRLRELAFVYANVTDVPASALDWGAVVIDRTNRAWHELFNMAQLFLRSQYQSTSGGAGQGTAILFEMSALFEDYVGRLVKRALAGTQYQVSLQGGRLFCLTSVEDERAAFQTRPDILIRSPDTTIVHVIDTKWKRLSCKNDDPKQGVSQSDIYQMMAYAHLYQAPRLTLLYPHNIGLGDKDGIQAQFRITHQQTLIETASVDIANGQDLVARLRVGLFRDFGEAALVR